MTTTATTTAPAPYAQVPSASAIATESNGFSISSLVLGIVSIFASFTFFVPVVGLVLGIMALKREPASRTMAIWGIVLNGVMLAGTVLVTLGTLAFGLVMLPFAFI
ncbi:DUF4190 domain-containing protein [Agromyces aureus]|uniref:DUF4190 domain-containing protein n=1 Tax=Agromyces aureus TaxID=453304 RepID=UPI0009FC6AF0|nr:DUF4190 domain-containing protein [Agromyces aureus]